MHATDWTKLPALALGFPIGWSACVDAHGRPFFNQLTRVMNKKQLILKQLKTKAKAFGFSKKELESVADTISNNLDVAEDASDEDVNAAIESSVDAVLPFLKVSQSAANRAIQAFRDAHPVDEDNDDDDEGEGEEPDTKSTAKKSTKKGTKSQTTSDDEPPAWAKKLLDRIDKIEGATTADKRLSQLEELVKDTGTFATRTIKAFKRMTFKTDDEFEEYLEDVKSDLEELNQERANDGLSKLGSVPNAGSKKDEHKDEVQPMTEDELKELADGF